MTIASIMRHRRVALPPVFVQERRSHVVAVMGWNPTA